MTTLPESVDFQVLDLMLDEADREAFRREISALAPQAATLADAQRQIKPEACKPVVERFNKRAMMRSLRVFLPDNDPLIVG
jgi:hypothetical protein